MTKELVLLYFRNKSTFQEDRIVEDWLRSSSANTKQAMKWMDELTDEEEKLFLKIVLSGNEVWEKTVSEINLNEPQNRYKTEGNNSWIHIFYKHTYRYAAILISIVMLTFAFYVYRIHSVIEIKTDFGKVKEIILPDGSTVMMNGNSRLRYAYSWKKRPREVWLEGEAFFYVKHKTDHSEFKVYLPGKKTIEVLGTEFNVSERALKSSIFLKSGKIMLHIANKSTSKNIELKPGELLELESGNSKTNIPEKVANPEKYYGWTKSRWILDRTSLREMLLTLEENYGIHVDVEDQALLERHVSGSIPFPANNADILIADIANLFQLQVVEKNNTTMLVIKGN